MPRRPSFRSNIIADLNRQLAFAPVAVQRSRLESAEALIRSIDPNGLYPIDFVTFKLTGYRPDDAGDNQLVGDALRADLVTMIQVASRACPLAWDGDRGQALDLDAVAERLGCARRSIRTLRPRGLVMWWTHPPGQLQRLGCPPDMLEWFAANNPMKRLHRIDAALRGQIEQTADVFAKRAAEGPQVIDLTLADVVRHTAQDLGVGEVLVRGVLRRSVDAGGLSLPRAKRLKRRDGRLALRALRRGLPVATIARRLSTGVSSVHRSLQRERLALMVRHLARPCFTVDAQAPSDVPSTPPPRLQWDSVLLLGAEQRAGQNRVAAITTAQLCNLGHSMRHMQVLVKAANGRCSADAWAQLDAGLMDLTRRWWEVLLGLGPSIEAGLRGWSGQGAASMPMAVIGRLLPKLLDVAIVTLQRASSSDAPRLPDRTRMSIDRVLIDPRTHNDLALEASPRGVFLLRHTPWRLLLPDPRWERAVTNLNETDATLARQRFGLQGEPLSSVSQCATILGCSTQAISARTSWLRQRLHELSAASPSTTTRR